jgi:aerobic-type carbon monoxide dehydrogenase small subunit (CoxS/CutS family)
MNRQFRFSVNGRNRTTMTDADRPLLDVLREDLHLTGTKYGCGEGECGCCTVLVEGEPTRSCITAVGDVEGKRVQTIEGLATAEELHPVQRAFLDQQAMQCGYCVPGHIMTAAALVRDHPAATDDEIVAAMSRHICRCGNYSSILAAVKQVVKNSKNS